MWFPMKTENCQCEWQCWNIGVYDFVVVQKLKIRSMRNSAELTSCTVRSSQIQTLKSYKLRQQIHCILWWAESKWQVGGAHKCKPVKFGKYCQKIEQIHCILQWAESKCQIGGACKCKTVKFDKYCWKIEQIQCFLRAETKWQSGGARRMAVTLHFVSEPECGQGQLLAETPTYPILILSSWRVTKKIALEQVEVKFPRF